MFGTCVNTLRYYPEIINNNYGTYVYTHLNVHSIFITSSYLEDLLSLVADQQNMHEPYYFNASCYETTLHNREFLQAFDGIFA